jgi:hypothetical protein
LNQLHSFKEEIYETGSRPMEGVLIVKEYPTKSASHGLFEHILEKLRMRDINPDMVIM